MSAEGLILECRTIAVVGLSRDEGKPSHEVARYLQSKGKRIIPVNPSASEILNEKCYKSLPEIPDEPAREIELVDIFRRAEDVPPIVDEAIALKQKYGKLKGIWMQLGIANEEAAERARAAGLAVIMDKCAMIEHKRLISEGEGV